jgi:type IV secretory pathway VirB10-like protein
MEPAIQQQTIKHKAPKPAGLVPKNLQAFVLVGLALLMVLIMALTGHKRPVPTPNSETTASVPNLVPLNTDKVTDFEKRIEDTQRASAPQAEAALLRQQKQLAAEGTGPQPFPSSPYGTPVTSPNPNGAYPPGAYASALPQPVEGQPAADPLKDEQRKRQYVSLFSDNVALTYRKEGQTANSSSPTATAHNEPLSAQDQLIAQAGAELARQGQLLAQNQQAGLASRIPSPNQPAIPNTPPTTLSPNQSETAKPKTSEPISAQANSPQGRSFVLFEGTVVEAVLLNRLDGSFSGPVECLVSNDVYSHDRQHILIPAGSKVLGEATKVDALGQVRLAVAFHRLIMPDGYSVSLDQFHSAVPGLDQQGATALKDKVNNHYTRIFGASLALGVLGSATQVGTGSALEANGADRIRQGFSAGLGTAGEQILDRFLNILPTVTIREGTRVKIYLSGDLLLPDYRTHTLPSDI